jgi:hypothetical protein
MFGKVDPLVEELRDQIAWLRKQVEDKDEQILALTNAQAYRLTHPNEAPEPPAAPVVDPRSDFRPTYTQGEIRESFGGS